MVANWDWFSFAVGVVATIIVGAGIALLFAFMGSDTGGF